MRIASRQRSLSSTHVHRCRRSAAPQAASGAGPDRTDRKIIRRSEPEELTGPVPGRAHLSAFAPITSRGPRAAQNPIRWKNPLVHTEAALRDVVDPAQVEATPTAVRRLAPEHPVRRAWTAGRPSSPRTRRPARIRTRLRRAVGVGPKGVTLQGETP